MKDLGDRTERLVKHLADEMTYLDSISEEITPLCSIIVILKTDKIPCPRFTLTSAVSEQRDKESVKSTVLAMKKLKEEVRKSLHIKSKDECMSLVNTAVEVNEREWKQQFSDVEVSDKTMQALEKDMALSYTYLHSKVGTKSTGVIHIHVI